MLLFIFGGALLGLGLAWFFRVYILWPTGALLIFLMLSNPFHLAENPLGALFSIAFLITGLQIGYFVGVFLKSGSPVHVRVTRRVTGNAFQENSVSAGRSAPLAQPSIDRHRTS